MPLELTALPIFPEFLSAALSPGMRKQSSTLFAGSAVNPGELLGSPSGSAEVLEPGSTKEKTRRPLISWTPEQPAEFYPARPGFHLLRLPGQGDQTVKKILPVNLMRRTGGWLAKKEREHLPRSVTPEDRLKLSTLTSDGSGNLNVTPGEMIRMPLTAHLTLALIAVLLLENLFSMLSSRRRRETEQC